MSPHPAALASEPDPRYPVGRFVAPEPITSDDRLHAISVLAELPSELRNAVLHLDEKQLGTPYRDGGWTVRQVVHHIADSHTLAVIRTKLALTADAPSVVAFDEKAWAGLHDYTAPVEWSLELIEALHARWVLLLQSLTPAQWLRESPHPRGGLITIERTTLLYAWHSRHHVAHITHLRARNNW